ncbi:arginine utilization protein RocB [Clostridiales Family XIII bacterium PM5-7]
MNNHDINFEQISQRVKDILYDYVKVQSYTNTPRETEVEDFFTKVFADNAYFNAHPECSGLYPIENDPLKRNVCWAMVKGEGPKTVVLVHHYDIVGVEDYKMLSDLAFSPDQLREELLQHKELLPPDAKKDLEEDTFLFCRGGADMKGGGSIQYALLESYSQLSDFQGNVIVIGVPDEENLSGGMRSAVKLLAELKTKYDLDYLMMINSEPHQRKDFDQGIFSEGSVGKMMPFIYVRGFLSHAGKVFEGFNPVSLLSEIITRTEVNMDFADVMNEEAAPPPTWLYTKDSKDCYDVSMPLTAQGCFSVLTLNQTPQKLIEKVQQVCEDSFQAVIERMNANYHIFCLQTNQPKKDLPWKKKVVSFGELYQEAEAHGGETFVQRYKEAVIETTRAMENGSINMIEGNFKLVDVIYDYIEDIEPRIVYGLLPPYYPNVSNIYFDQIAPEAQDLSAKLRKYTLREFDQEYTREFFYTGICDLSYINIDQPEAHREALQNAMPLFGEYYDIPFEEIEEIAMGGINIGPWGKDFHKLTERVHKDDLYHRTPRILDHAIKILLG